MTIPQWLNTKAEKAGVNFSQILQEALKERLKNSILRWNE
jgi:antitoxin HicB